jgi:transcription-repair coupling factor (superfamily II helicase)
MTRSNSSPSRTLGDRLVRRKKKRKDADAFLAELSALTPGDLVVHMDHGIGRYDGLKRTTVGKSAARLRAAHLCRGDKLYIPVENLDVLSRYGAENDGVALDKLGGEGWQKRRAKLKERIREIAHELLKTAALARCAGPVLRSIRPATPVRRPLPWHETEDQDAPSTTC